MFETAKDLPTRPMSQRQLLPSLVALIDVLMDPEAKEQRTDVWCYSFVELDTLLKKPGVWDLINNIPAGNRTTYIQHGLGIARMAFLEAFGKSNSG